MLHRLDAVDKVARESARLANERRRFRDSIKRRPGEVFWHLNVWTSGRICLNLLNEPDGTWHGQWSPSITIKQILCAIQELLDNPFPAGARPEVQTLYERNRPAYERRLRQEADKYRKRPLPDDDDDVVVIE